ncbi:Serine protease htra2, mitochondrial [Physocladia obscura]|uniref:Serine protease htra2, mitochondrial n=1 Tax=Physocladia obscura TaxID=109957 RepID=A0AAD5XCP6_9FUNG|nr:Serine protease htra2, mitochondrial [Physocladia obscura]
MRSSFRSLGARMMQISCKIPRLGTVAFAVSSAAAFVDVNSDQLLPKLICMQIETDSAMFGSSMWRRWSEKKQDTVDLDLSRCIKCNSNRSNNFIADAAEQVLDSVVNILMETEVSVWFSQKSVCSRGSGFFITADGKVLTNAHVVQDYVEGSKITVTTSNGREYGAYIHAVDYMSDLAIIAIIPDYEAPDWKPVHLGSNKEPRAGDWVVSIGNPFGLQNTVTAGVLSSHRRKSVEIGGLDSRIEYFQTDCVVHSGSSGGPLINLDGEVIGINTIRADSEGISFAIKVDHAMEMIYQLVDHGKIIRPWFGFGMVSLSPYIQPESPAEKAGCCAGDVIIEVNSVPMTSASQFLKYVGLNVDKRLNLLVERNTMNEIDGTAKYSLIKLIIEPKIV